MRGIGRTVERRLPAILLLACIAFVGMTVVDILGLRDTVAQRMRQQLARATEDAVAIAREEHTAAIEDGIAAADAQRNALRRIAALQPDIAATLTVDHVEDGLWPFSRWEQGRDGARTTEPGGALVGAIWPRPGDVYGEPRLLEVAGFEPWGWLIGAGVRADEIDGMVNRSAIEQIVVALALLAAAGGGVAVALTRRNGTPRPPQPAPVARFAPPRGTKHPGTARPSAATVPAVPGARAFGQAAA